MDSAQRGLFNHSFTINKYKDFLADLSSGNPEILFRVAETPLFLTENIKEQLLKAADDIIQFIGAPEFKNLTDDAIPKKWNVPNENSHPHFLSIDFGLCEGDEGQIVPMLIELQGFPSLFGFQFHLANQYQTAFDIPKDWTVFNDNINEFEYFTKLKHLIVGSLDARHVVMLDYKPHLQKTAIDFSLTVRYLGLKVLSIEEILEDKGKLYYLENEERIPIKRIYNRLIFDELESITDIFEGFDPRKIYDVEWITHPNWFYRVSKYTMPFLKGKYVPDTKFLNEVIELPEDLENYVLKPLFSFAGLGVIIDLKIQDIQSVKDPENWILQRKVNYAPVIFTPEGIPVKAEVRLMYIWEDERQPELLINLTRLSRGNMIGVRYNKHLDWVGGSVAFMKKINH